MNTGVKDTLLARVYDVAIESPLEPALKLTSQLGVNVFLKREDLQPVHSFKLRGAYNKMAQLTEEEKAKGVIAASAGNHAQGVALSAKRLGISAVIVMPETTPEIKVAAVKALGGEVVLHGDSYSDAYEYSQKLVREKGRVFVHPFDDPLVIAGQGTIGREILEQLPIATHIFVPVGGGGLIAGIAQYVKHLRPDIKVIGVEPADTIGQAMPDGWKPLTFKKIPKHTVYEMVKDGGVTIVKAVSNASASGRREWVSSTRSLQLYQPARGALARLVRGPSAAVTQRFARSK